MPPDAGDRAGPEDRSGPGDGVEALPPPATDPAVAAAAQLALDRYDAALTELAAEPAALIDAAHPAHVGFLSTLAPGTALGDDVVADLRARLGDEGSVVRPVGGRPSWEHHVATARVGPGGTLELRWCGRSTGVGVHVSTGEVTDAATSVSSGIGRLVRHGDGWVVASLDQLEVAVVEVSPTPGPACGGRS